MGLITIKDGPVSISAQNIQSKREARDFDANFLAAQLRTALNYLERKQDAHSWPVRQP